MIKIAKARNRGAKSAPILNAPQLFERFFDATWYAETYPDVKEFGWDAKDHYLKHGYSEKRSPHPLFDLHWYSERHPEVFEAGVEPLSHYFDRGWRMLHSPHPLFDPTQYLMQNIDLVAADVDPLRHYLDLGKLEGRTLHPLFDTSWYLETNRDVADVDYDPLSHFLTFGWKEKRRPHPLFDIDWYLEQNGDVATAGVNPWLHYIRFGWKEGRSPHPQFDARWYVEQYLDGTSQSCEPLAHYLSWGWREGLLPSSQSHLKPNTSGCAAPLYLRTVDELARTDRKATSLLNGVGRRGTLVLVLHETEVGGAPHVLKQFACWLRDRTRFDVRLVSLRGGNLRHTFAEIAPLLVLADHAEESRSEILKEWMGSEVRAVFLNSIASGAFLNYIPANLPTIAFIHELPQLLELFPSEVELVRARAQRVIGGGPEVTRALQERYDFEPEKLASAVSFIEALPGDVDFAQRRSEARSGLGLDEKRVVIMGCGILHWRKSPDKFIEVAEIVLGRGIDADFIWLGGGPDQEACEQMLLEKGLENRVRFAGYEPDVPGKLAAADIFVLSSQEDPFPLVALYAAQAGLPIVCFQEAGGIEGFVSKGSGVAVPFMDVGAMADAVERYALDQRLRENDGLVGREQVERSHTIDVIGPLLLHHLRDATGLVPEVSVVVPNYNYEPYLPERLKSISEQTFQDFEVILLDDASEDESVDILEDFAARRPGTRVVVNKCNSGSPFVQWMRGMEMARADLVWLAEADDRCRPELLATLLPFFDDRNVRIASCASQPITASGEVIGDYRPMYLDRITPGRWNRDYMATDHEEAQRGLGIANSFPNASAVIFRKFRPEASFIKELTEMKLCGDWYFYVRAMHNGLVGFSASIMNDHRRHDNTVTHKLEGSLRYFNELSTVRAYIGRTYRQSAETRAKIAEFLTQDIVRFNIADAEELPSAPAPSKSVPSLLMVAPDLAPGGGQVFAISLANEWSRRGGRVILLNVGNQETHPAMLLKIAPEVILLEARMPDADLATLHRRFDIDIVHSGIWWADRWVDDNRDALPEDMPWIISMHGCHETIMAEPDIDRSFPERIARMIDRASWVYTAEKNLKVFETHGRPDRLARICNGMNEEPVRRRLQRKDLGLREAATVLCLASRAIDSKGWDEAVRVTSRLNREGHNVDLMLIGEGPSAEKIRGENPEHVRLLGQVANLQDYLAIADVGLLPSSFVGESFPLVLIEMMAKSLPIVASAVGEIPWMLGNGDDSAGLLVPIKEDCIDEEALYAAIVRLMDPDFRREMGQASHRRFETQFTLERMLDCYCDIYDSEKNGLEKRWRAAMA